MAHRRPTFDSHSNESKLPRSNGGNIKDKISLWEGKEPTHSPVTSGPLGQCASVKRTESLTKSNSKTTEEQNAECCRTIAYMEKENLGKANGDSRPCSPAEAGKQQRGTLRGSKSSENRKGEDCSRVVHKEKQDHEKENVEKLQASRPCSPAVAGQQQVGTLRKSNDRRTGEQTNPEKRAVFTLFKKLEAMGDNHGKTPTELGNYFSPPSKDKWTEVKKKESEVIGQTSAVTSRGTKDGTRHQENVYTEPGAPPINPVPKPQRTFQHPATVSSGKSGRQGRGQRNLPPLPSDSTKTSSKPPSGVYGRPRGERVRNNINRYGEKKILRLDVTLSGRASDHIERIHSYFRSTYILISPLLFTMKGNPLSLKTSQGQLVRSSLLHCLNITTRTSSVSHLCYLPPILV